MHSDSELYYRVRLQEMLVRMVSVKLKERKRDYIDYRSRTEGWDLRATFFTVTGGLNIVLIKI